jgi:hypothetical protein
LEPCRVVLDDGRNASLLAHDFRDPRGVWSCGSCGSGGGGGRNVVHLLEED